MEYQGSGNVGRYDREVLNTTVMFPETRDFSPDVVHRHLLAKDGISSLGVDPVVKKVANNKKEIDGNLDIKPGRMLLLNWMNNLSDEQFSIVRSLLRNALLVNDPKMDTAELIMQMISNAKKLSK